MQIPYQDAAQDFAHFAHHPGSFFLDSSLYEPRQARYSFWGVNPENCFESREGFVTLDGHTQIGSPVETLKKFYKKTNSLPLDPYIPFSGGLVGFVGYEWGSALENITSHPSKDFFLPDAWFGFYDTVVMYDHLEKTCRVVSRNTDTAEELAGLIVNNRKKILQRAYERTSVRAYKPEFFSSFSKESFMNAVQKILVYLKAGDCYQVNLTQRFMAPYSEPPWNLYSKLREISPAPYSAYINGGTFQILSASPELFLQSKPDGTLITRPIKGTRRRGKTLREDETLAHVLEKSEKDAAELLMITDLERNDLGKVCEPGSVKVSELQALQTLPQVHHLYSTIQGKRKEGCDIIDCLAAMSPGGSITGAPKIRAMEIIQELEPCPRGPYTGALGYLGPANTGQFNIPIRTIVVQDATAFFHAGAGIVVDSEPEAEYEETMLKAKAMMEALGI